MVGGWWIGGKCVAERCWIGVGWLHKAIVNCNDRHQA